MSTDFNANKAKAEAGVSRRSLIQLTGAGAAAIGLTGAASWAGVQQAFAAPVYSKDLPTGDTSNGADNFYTSDQVTVKKISFGNRYEMKVVGNLFVPNGLNRGTTIRRW